MKKLMLWFCGWAVASASLAQGPARACENLVFEGAGIRGLAYAGVLHQLEAAGLTDSLKRVGGTSAGAITALLVALGYRAAEVEQLVGQTRFQQFNDGQWMFVGGLARLWGRYGWYRGRAADRWLGQLIAAKAGDADLTFAQLRERGFRELRVTGTCLNQQKLLVFSAETYPHMKVRDAVRISISVPLYFEAVFIDQSGAVYPKPKGRPGLDVVVDGGLLANYPIFLFDSLAADPLHRPVRYPNPHTLGVRIDSEAQIAQDSLGRELAPQPIQKLPQYLGAFYNLVIETMNRSQLTPADWERTISVASVGIAPKVRRLSPAEKARLTASGAQAVQRFLGQ
jgi:NTE family protein